MQQLCQRRAVINKAAHRVRSPPPKQELADVCEYVLPAGVDLHYLIAFRAVLALCGNEAVRHEACEKQQDHNALDD